MSSADLRRWMSGFEAAANAERERRRLHGSRPDDAVALAASLIEAAWQAANGPPRHPLRTAADDRARQTWCRLRARLARR